MPSGHLAPFTSSAHTAQQIALVTAHTAHTAHAANTPPTLLGLTETLHLSQEIAKIPLPFRHHAKGDHCV
jgi:hypothetical protein